MAFVCAFAFAACGSTPEPSSSQLPSSQSESAPVPEPPKPEPEESSEDDSVGYGEQLSLIENEIDGKNVCILKYKITPSYNNKATINQNYHTVEKFILDGGDQYDEIQYWAVADMTSGNESKVISFTLDADTIQKVYNKEIVAIEFEDYADDLWILPSLLD